MVDYGCPMSAKERAIDAIRRMPEDVDLHSILREVSLMTGTEDALEEIRRGEGMTATEAKKQFSEWLSK